LKSSKGAKLPFLDRHLSIEIAADALGKPK
jgi:hypothetical protein